MTTIAVIPARYASTRFPGKPLAQETGKYLIQHVVERVRECDKIDRVLVATDDDRIVRAVESFGGEAVMTRADHVIGTERVREASDLLGLAGDDLVLNVQGDEPEITPAVLDLLVGRMEAGSTGSRIGTLAARFRDDGPCSGPGSPADPNCVKVVVDAAGRALYFSRSLVPYPRDTMGVVNRPSRWLLHLGVYVFRVDALHAITSDSTGPSVLESDESLEQLRWLDQGHAVEVVSVNHPFVGIDTRDDYDAFVKRTVGKPSEVV